MTSDLSTLLRKEVERAKTEAREEIGQAGKATAIFGAAGVAGWLALLMLSLAVAWLLDQALNTALSFAIVGIAWTTFHRKEPLSGRPPVRSVPGSWLVAWPVGLRQCVHACQSAVS